MTVENHNSSISAKIAKDGFYLIRRPEPGSLSKLFTSIGEVIQQTEITENPQSTRLLASSQAMPYHTDHHAAKYIAWFCHSQSATGGMSLLLDTNEILNDFSESSLSLLQEINVKTHRVFYGDKIHLPLLTIEGEKRIIYYAPWLIEKPFTNKHQKALTWFEESIRVSDPIQILLSEGDLLIIDNQRILHGREAFPKNSNRWLTRYWIK